MKKGKILVLSPLPPPFYGSAISSQMCLKIMEESDKFEVRSVKINYSKEFNDVGNFAWSKVTGFFRTAGQIISTTLKFKPELVYFMPATAGFALIRDFLFSMILKLLNKNIIFHLRTQITENEKNDRIKNILFKTAFKNARVIVLGKKLETEVQPYFQKEKIFTLPNAIEKKLTDIEFKKTEEKRRRHSTLRLVFLSNMMKSKGWPDVLEAAGILHAHNISFVLNFAGSWPSDREKNEFYEIVDKYSIAENTNYIGYVNDEQKHELLANSDILIFPSKNEAFGRVVIEAMEYGIPVVASKTGSIPEIIIHQKTGFLSSSPNDIANCVTELQDVELRIKMGRLARQRFLSTYELSVYRENLIAIIEEALKSLRKKNDVIYRNSVELKEEKYINEELQN